MTGTTIVSRAVPGVQPKPQSRLVVGLNRNLASVEEEWRSLLTGEHPRMRRGRRFLGLIPSNPRCKMCYAPFGTPGMFFMRLGGRGPSNLNPNVCNLCERFAVKHPGGAEIEISMLFADVRGSTTLAERISPSEFSRLMNRFYQVATGVLLETEAIIDKFVGDEVVALYVPALAGSEHPSAAVRAGRELLRATGQGDPGGPSLPIGIGIHTGIAFVGSVGTAGVTDITALGDAVNTTARLASAAGPGEALLSEATCAAAGLDTSGMEQRRLELKGRSERVRVRVLRDIPASPEDRETG